VAREDPAIFKELDAYVRGRASTRRYRATERFDALLKPLPRPPHARIVSRRFLGEFTVETVRADTPRTLNAWLTREGYQPLRMADDVIEFYRSKRFVFVCIKVRKAPLSPDKAIQLRPLRFTFTSRPSDGIFFPMKMTGLQTAPFGINLHVFTLTRFDEDASKGHEGFAIAYGEDEYTQPRPWSKPETDPALARHRGGLRSLTSLFQALHPDERYHLTSLNARHLKPREVRSRRADVWLHQSSVDPR
jgi:hypothetical protein